MEDEDIVQNKEKLIIFKNGKDTHVCCLSQINFFLNTV